MFEQRGLDAVENMGADPFVRRIAGDGQFRRHSAGPGFRFSISAHSGDILVRKPSGMQRGNTGVRAVGMSVDSVGIGNDRQVFGSDHSGDKKGVPIVIGPFSKGDDFLRGSEVVFVENRERSKIP